MKLKKILGKRRHGWRCARCGAYNRGLIATTCWLCIRNKKTYREGDSFKSVV